MCITASRPDVMGCHNMAQIISILHLDIGYGSEIWNILMMTAVLFLIHCFVILISGMGENFEGGKGRISKCLSLYTESRSLFTEF